MYKGVIFDFNGTLIFDTKYHNCAWDKFLEKHDIIMSEAEKIEKIHGMSNSEILKNIFKREISQYEIKKWSAEKERYYREFLIADNLKLAPGIEVFLNSLLKKNIKIAIATSSDYENIEFYIKNYNLLNWFKRELIIYNDGTLRGKPAPDLYIRASEKMGIKNNEIIVFEDSLFGIMAAKKFGPQKIIVVNPEEYVKNKINEMEIIENFNQLSILI